MVYSTDYVRHLNDEALVDLDRKIRENIILRDDFIFDMVEPNTIYVNDKSYNCFYIVTYDKNNDNYLYIGITPNVDKTAFDYHFKQHGILNGKDIIKIVDDYYNINIDYITKEEM